MIGTGHSMIPKCPLPVLFHFVNPSFNPPVLWRISPPDFSDNPAVPVFQERPSPPQCRPCPPSVCRGRSWQSFPRGKTAYIKIGTPFFYESANLLSDGFLIIDHCYIQNLSPFVRYRGGANANHRVSILTLFPPLSNRQTAAYGCEP